MRKHFALVLLLAILMTACDGWVYVVPTFPAPPPSPTPAILSPTPLFMTVTPVPGGTTVVETASPSATPTWTATESLPETATPSPTVTSDPANIDLLVEVLGCKTGFDITHGMGEVTDAFVTIRNNGTATSRDVCATLFALDEGRPHPDKTVCIPELQVSHMVTLKLTVDSTYQQASPFQVEVKNGESLVARVGQPSCTEISGTPPDLSGLRTPVPIP